MLVGPNGSGKTSLLEAIHLLGRGRSFRAPDLKALTRADSAGFAVAATVAGSPPRRLRVEHTRGETVNSVDGQGPAPLADLVSALRVQIVSSHVHELVEGAPSGRRRLLDWGVFHVEHQHLKNLQRYRRILRQRTAVLQTSTTAPALDVWEDELARAAMSIDEARERFLDTFAAKFHMITSDSLHFDADLDYFRGWPSEDELRQRLQALRPSDAERGFAQLGPHRADLRVRGHGQALRNRSSRGQQKLLGAALVLAAMAVLPEAATGTAPVLLVDEPAADLDSGNLRLLSKALQATPAQLFIASLQQDAAFDGTEKRVFHVELGEVKPLI